jgi:flagellar biosynthesis protein FlhA
VVTLDPLVEQGLITSLQRGEGGSYLNIDPDVARRLGVSLVRRLREVEQEGREPVIVCAPSLRPAFHGFVARLLPHVPVLSYNELAEHLIVDDLGAVGLDEATV